MRRLGQQTSKDTVLTGATITSNTSLACALVAFKKSSNRLQDSCYPQVCYLLGTCLTEKAARSRRVELTGMPVPVRKLATSSQKLLQLLSNKEYVSGVNTVLSSARYSWNTSSGTWVLLPRRQHSQPPARHGTSLTEQQPFHCPLQQAPRRSWKERKPGGVSPEADTLQRHPERGGSCRRALDARAKEVLCAVEHDACMPHSVQLQVASNYLQQPVGLQSGLSLLCQACQRQVCPRAEVLVALLLPRTL